MNICDSPTRVSIAQGWRENDVIQRIPIIVTGGFLNLRELQIPLMHPLPLFEGRRQATLIQIIDKLMICTIENLCDTRSIETGMKL